VSGGRVKGLTAEGFIPHQHLWYRADRIVAQLEVWGWPEQAVTTHLGQASERFARRWYEIKGGNQSHFRLPVVDDLLVELGLNLTAVLGEPDLHSALPPAQALAKGIEPCAPPSYDELPIREIRETSGEKVCRRGHVKSPENTRREGGRLRCKECDRERKSPHNHVYQQEQLAV